MASQITTSSGGIILLNPLTQSGEQTDGSVVDIHGGVITMEKRLEIIECVEGLPVTRHRKDIMKAVEANPITIVQAETGSGKTTQIPKMLTHLGRVIVTQPRVIAAISNAQRVADELLSFTGDASFSLGARTGYRTWKGVSSTQVSPLSFHTDGTELMRQAVSWIFPDVLILDEVHGNSIPTEVLAMLQRVRFLKEKNPKFRLVIMSATLEPGLIQEYFKKVSIDIPVIRIPGRTFPVTKYLDSDENCIDETVKSFNEWKNILLFAPGKREIEEIITQLRSRLWTKTEIYALHAEIPKEKQQFLMTKTNDSQRIVVATNIAQESVTIPYVEVVIDLALQKTVYHNHLGIPDLRLENTQQWDCIQRAGRAGRTGPGVYKRLNNYPYAELMDFAEAPMSREMLDRHILLLLSTGINIMQQSKEAEARWEQLFFHKFNENLLLISLSRLERLWAITKDQKITSLGRDLVKFPLEVYHARMIYEGINRSCAQDMIYAAAILEKKGFVSKDGGWKSIELRDSWHSDLLNFVALLKLVTSTTLTKKQLEVLRDAGADETEINIFVLHNGARRFFEVVDVTKLWLKKQNVEDIWKLIEILTAKLLDSDLPVTNWWKVRDRKACIATGMLHNIYKYSKERNGFINISHRANDSAMIFRAGDVSSMELIDGWLYTGEPFIIGNSSERGDLNLLTFITVVDQEIINEAEASARKFTSFNLSIKNSWVPESKETEKKRISKWASTLPSPQTRKTNLIADKESLPLEKKVRSPSSRWTIVWAPVVLDDWRDNFAETQLEWKEYYLQFVLPDFLIEHNLWIRKYLLGKSEDYVSTFRELLKRYLLDNEAYRISPMNIEKTERSFRYDSGILDNFLDSDNPVIKYFLKHGHAIIPPVRTDEIITGKAVGLWSNMEENIDINKEFQEILRSYAWLIGNAKHYTCNIPLQRVKEDIIEDFIKNLEINPGDEYCTLMSEHAYLKTMNPNDRTEIAKWLKSLKQDRLENAKISEKISHLRSIMAAIKSASEGNKYDREVIKDSSFLSPKEGANYRHTLTGLISKDTSVRTRSRNGLKKYIINLEWSIEKLSIQKKDFSWRLNKKTHPHWVAISNALKVVLQRYFTQEYFGYAVASNLLQLTRSIVNDPSGRKKWVESIITSYLLEHGISHVIGREKEAKLLTHYNDLLDTIEEYKGVIYTQLVTSKDIEFGEQRVGELKKLIEKLQEAQKALKASPLLKGYIPN